jgi:hypothetical protein
MYTEPALIFLAWICKPIGKNDVIAIKIFTWVYYKRASIHIAEMANNGNPISKGIFVFLMILFLSLFIIAKQIFQKLVCSIEKSFSYLIMLRILIVNVHDGSRIETEYSGFRVSKQNGRMGCDDKLYIVSVHQLMKRYTSQKQMNYTLQLHDVDSATL